MKISRRTFLKNGAATGTAASLASSLTILTPRRVLGAPSSLNKWPGRVVLNYDDRHGCTSTGGNANSPAAVKTMVDSTIKMLTGQTDVGQAWKSIFPSLTLSTKIMLKTNCIYPGVIPHPYLVKAIVEGLLQMPVEGSRLPAANISLYERGRTDGSVFPGANYTAVLSGTGIAMTEALAPDYQVYGDGAFNNRGYSKYVRACDYIINMTAYKGHGYMFTSGITSGFKSHYGTYANPEEFHGDATAINSKLFLRAINTSGPVYNKQVLTVLGNLFASDLGMFPHEGASSYRTWSQTKNPAYTGSGSNAIAMSTDPVTAEALAFKIMRINKGLTYGIGDMPDYLRASAGIDVSGFTPTYNIGQIDESKWVYGEILNGATTHNIPAPTVGTQHPGLARPEERISVYPNPATSHASIDFVLPTEYTGQTAEIGIYNVRGAAVRRFRQTVMGGRTTSLWNGMDSRGRPVSGGAYVAEVRVGGRKLVRQFSLVR